MTILERLHKGVELQTAGRNAEAERIYLEILEESPDNPDANHLLGLIRSEQDRYEEATALIEKAIGLNPHAAPFHHNIAGIYRRLGRGMDAEHEFREAIRLKADYGEAYQGLAEMRRFEADDPAIPLLLEQLGKPGHDDRVAQYFHFAAGKIFDDLGDYDRAFQHYLTGNRLAHREFDIAAHRSEVKDTIYVYGPAYVGRRRAFGSDSELPVFVVGMPRSGTTLVEQIIASHSRVYGAGELNDLKAAVKGAEQLSAQKSAWPGCMPLLADRALPQLARFYIERLRTPCPDEGIERIVDKHPLNFRFIGFIFELFPRARIVHTRRDPMDTCLSCFFQNFTKGQDYSFDLRTLAHFYNDYARLMEHWKSLYGERILDVDYEALIADQEAESRRLIEFCGLPWEDACLDFHKTERVVKTASFLQVRQPIYKSSQGRWKRYTEQMREVGAIIGVPIETPVTISASHAWLRSGG